MKKYAIFTSLVGGYDEIHQPLIIDDRFDYILFTDVVDQNRIGVWDVRKIQRAEANNMRLSRYVKCHPTIVLSEYEASLYLDANIQITTSFIYDRFIELLDSEVEWSSVKHPTQNCIYEEICAIVDLKWVHDYDVVGWYAQMKREGFPELWGLYENNVIFRKHTTKILEVGSLWWQSLVSGCKRDQFSLMFILWKTKTKINFLLPEGECPRLNSDNFKYYEHKPHKRIQRMGFAERVRRSIVRGYNENTREGYHILFNKLSKYNNPRRMLYMWEVYASIVYSPLLVLNAIKVRIARK